MEDDNAHRIQDATGYTSPGQDVDRGPPADRETIYGGPPVHQARG
jgi:hypothetical protein